MRKRRFLQKTLQLRDLVEKLRAMGDSQFTQQGPSFLLLYCFFSSSSQRKGHEQKISHSRYWEEILQQEPLATLEHFNLEKIRQMKEVMVRDSSYLRPSTRKGSRRRRREGGREATCFEAWAGGVCVATPNKALMPVASASLHRWEAQQQNLQVPFFLGEDKPSMQNGLVRVEKMLVLQEGLLDGGVEGVEGSTARREGRGRSGQHLVLGSLRLRTGKKTHLHAVAQIDLRGLVLAM